LAHFINDGSVFFVPFIAAILAAQKGVSPLDISLMFFVFYASSSALSLYVGRVADRSGRAFFMIGLGLALLSTGMVVFYLSLTYMEGPSLILLIMLAAFIAGFGSAFYHPLGASVLQSAYLKKSGGLALGINGSLGSVGRALYPSLFFVIGAYLTGYSPIVFFAVVGFLAATIVTAGSKSDGDEKLMGNRVPQREGRSIMTKGIVTLTLIAFLRSLATQGISSWIPTYLSTQKGLGVSNTLGLSLTTMYASAIVGQPVFGLLMDRFDKRAVLGLSSVGSALSVLAYLSVSDPIVGLGVLFIFGFFTFSAFPLLLALTSDYVPRGPSSLANALVWGIGSTAGGVVGPPLVGAMTLNDYARLGFSFEVMAALVLISAVATTLVPKASKPNGATPSAA
jgi:MFS family permease